MKRTSKPQASPTPLLSEVLSDICVSSHCDWLIVLPVLNYNNNNEPSFEEVGQWGEDHAVQPDERSARGTQGGSARVKRWRCDKRAVGREIARRVHGGGRRKRSDCGMAKGWYAGHALHRNQRAGEGDKDAEVVPRAQEEHGVAIRNQQEQAQTQPNDEQHHLMITISSALHFCVSVHYVAPQVVAVRVLARPFGKLGHLKLLSAHWRLLYLGLLLSHLLGVLKRIQLDQIFAFFWQDLLGV